MILVYDIFQIKCRTKKIEVFSQGTNNSQHLRCETLYIGDYECVNFSSFAVLSISVSFISQNLKVVVLWEESLIFSVPQR